MRGGVGGSPLLVLGLDGTDWEILDPLIAAGELPAFAKLAQGGFCARLRSILPPLTAPAWTSLHTGVNPGAHGVFDFFHRAPDSYDVRHASAAPCTVRTVWGHLSDAGRRVALVGLPMAEVDEPLDTARGGPLDTARGGPLDGVHVGSILLEPGTVRPESLRRELLKRLDPGPLRRGRIGEGAAFARRWIARTFEIARALASEGAFDVLAVGLPVTDWIHHRFLHDPAVIRETYRAIDAALGDLLRALPEGTRALVCSDHGAQRVRGLLNVNGWLAERGFLARSGGAPGDRRGRLSGGHLRRGFGAQGLALPAARALRALIPEPFLVPLRALRSRRPGLDRLAHLDGVHWSRTRAYAVGYYGAVYFNLAGREPGGIVREAERPALAEEVTRALRAWRDPETGEPIMEAVLPGSEVYRGEFARFGPDLVAVPRGYAWGALPLPSAGAGVPAVRLARDLGRGAARDLAWHRLHGMLLVSRGSGLLAPSGAAGQPATPGDRDRPAFAPAELRRVRQSFSEGGKVAPTPECSILDVAPTVLALAGLAPPPWMEGRSLVPGPCGQTQNEKSKIENPPRWPAPPRKAGRTPLEKRLRDLGYFE